MCHYGAEEWEEVVQTLMEEDPEEEFKREKKRETEREDTKTPVTADD
jgi:hypothetical protein